MESINFHNKMLDEQAKKTKVEESRVESVESNEEHLKRDLRMPFFVHAEDVKRDKERMEREKHRCFSIPRQKLDIFLVSLDVNFSRETLRCKMSYVFLSEDQKSYDVVVSQYGSYPYLEKDLEIFAKALK